MLPPRASTRERIPESPVRSTTSTFSARGLRILNDQVKGPSSKRASMRCASAWRTAFVVAWDSTAIITSAT